MRIRHLQDSPFQLRLSFDKVIKQWEDIAALNDGPRAAMAREILKEVALYPELREGITEEENVLKHTGVIKNLLSEMFPESLTLNEIKAVSIPFQDVIFNPTKRLQNILKDAGIEFDVVIRDFSDHQFYVFSCCLILDELYGTNFKLSRPMFYDIPNSQGIMKHYRILYNADFVDIIPTENAPQLTQDDIELLRDNFDDLSLWKKYFPKNAWIMKGFAILTLYDATVENAVSALKGTLLGATYDNSLKDVILEVFRSIYKIPDLRIGFSSFNDVENTFSSATFDSKLKSYLLPSSCGDEFFDASCVTSLIKLVHERVYFSVSDVAKFLMDDPLNVLAKRFLEQGIQSFILAPVVKNGHLLGICELVSDKVGELNSINANHLEIVMPYITDTIDRQYTNMQNQIQALIQNEYTTIHPSVYWKFKKEAVKFIQYRGQKKDYALKEVAFSDVYPLYGQIDIKASSETRNQSVQIDLQNQLGTLISLLQQLNKQAANANIEDDISNLQELMMDVQSLLRADTEQQIQNYLETQIHPVLKSSYNNISIEINTAIDSYFERADKSGEFHYHRRKYETTVALINEKMALLLDRAQIQAQAIFPHYYERFKTDGVEHNLYIGASISPAKPFDINYLYNLRLWQMQVLCEMELEHHYLRNTLPYPLDVTSLILTFSLPISIRFRMDEKRFDVDGSYNARFEIVKKRIDKAFVKGTTERITAVNHLTIVYTNPDEELEYKSYIRFLQGKKMLGEQIEMLEVEDLQGVSGLKVLRVKILYNTSLPVRKFFTYAELLQEESQVAYN